VICPNRISPLSQSLISDIPNPDRPGSGSGGLDSNKSFAPFVNPNIQHVWGFTVDQILTPTQSVHYSQWRNSYTTHSFDYHPIVIAPNPLNSQKFEPAVGSVFLLNYTNTFSPHLVMTAGIGWIGEVNNQFQHHQGSHIRRCHELKNIPPNITFDGQHAPTSWGTSGSWFQSINRKLGIALVNNWLWTKGRNTFNIGWEFRRAYQDDNEEQTEGGHFAFSQRTTSVQNPSDPNFGHYGSAFCEFPVGTSGIPPTAATPRSWSCATGISHHISRTTSRFHQGLPSISVSGGIFRRRFTENHNLIVFFNQDKPGTFPGSNIAGSASQFGNCTGCSGVTRADIHYNHIGPRLGFAYQLSKKMVVQAGLDVAFLDGGAYEYGNQQGRSQLRKPVDGLLYAQQHG